MGQGAWQAGCAHARGGEERETSDTCEGVEPECSCGAATRLNNWNATPWEQLESPCVLACMHGHAVAGTPTVLAPPPCLCLHNPASSTLIPTNASLIYFTVCGMQHGPCISCAHPGRSKRAGLSLGFCARNMLVRCGRTVCSAVLCTIVALFTAFQAHGIHAHRDWCMCMCTLHRHTTPCALAARACPCNTPHAPHAHLQS